MGRFGIGARVRDVDGDLAEVIGKRKGFREVRYSGGKHDGMVLEWSKSSLEPANDNAGTPSISAEISESAYAAVGENSDKPWVPKVGDRVRFVRDSTAGGWCFGKAGEEAEVTELARGLGESLTVSVRLSTTKCAFDPGAYIRDLEPVVAPATTAAWTPKVGERVRPKPEHDAWVRRHWDTSWASKEGALNEMFVAAGGYSADSFMLSNRIGGNGPYWTTEQMEPAPLTIEAGKFYRTRGGRKVGPMSWHPEARKQAVWQGGGLEALYRGEWYAEGNFYDFSEHGNDLVAEWIEPAVHIGYDVRFEIGEPVAVAEATATPTPWKMKPRDEPAAPPAKFKVGDRVNYNLTDTAWQGVVIDKIYDSGSLSGIDPVTGHRGSFHEDWLELAPTIPVGSTVTFTATGRLSAYTPDGHAQIVFPGLTPGQNSFALPSKFVSLAN